MLYQLSPLNSGHTLLLPISEHLKMVWKCICINLILVCVYQINTACCSCHSVPTGPPHGVDATPVNSTSVTISWNPPAAENQNGVITGYMINLTRVGSEGISQYSSSSDNITVGSLHPFTTYAYTVAAQTSVGTGPHTTSSTVMTPEDGIIKYHFCYMRLLTCQYRQSWYFHSSKDLSTLLARRW